LGPWGLFALALILWGCGGGAPELHNLNPTPRQNELADSLLRGDPQGPIPRPTLPASLSSRDLRLGRDRAFATERVVYTTTVHSPDLPEAQAIFESVAALYSLQDRPLFSPLALSLRLRRSLLTGEDILKSLGYYEGQVTGWTERKDGDPGYHIVVNFAPGPLYHIGKIAIDRSPTVPEGFAESQPAPALEEMGVRAGDVARAADILKAVSDYPELWANRGYPFAALAGTRYTIDTGTKLLDIEIAIAPGEFVRAGELAIEGSNPVKREYILNQATWKEGDPWNQDEMERFRDNLFQKGLFLRAEVAVGDGPADDGTRQVALTLQPAPPRTVSGSLNYDSDFGPGMEVSWEHRNLTGWGDDFMVEIPVWRDLQQLGFKYSRPFFLSRQQTFLANAAFLREKSDSYDLKSVSASAGVERQFSRILRGALSVKLEAGKLNEFIKDERNYRIWGFPATFDWNWANNLMEPTRGHRLAVLVAPYMGFYYNNFQIFKTRVDAYQYFSLMDEGKLVLALRATVGNISGADTLRLPSSLRFFSGGGGSVRGYEYQSIGPRNAKDKPQGGNFLNEASAEIRWRFSETIGLTFFADGGNLWDEADFSRLGRDFLWGGGLGVRYYTAIGPFRLDLATPFTPRDGRDSPLQVYISLGQSF
jgi:translocation and assembly module TamA